MALPVTKFIIKLSEIYTQMELSAMLGVSSKSIGNYLIGGKPSKKTIGNISELYKQLERNNWERLPIEETPVTPSASMITAEGVLLRVLVQEFADYKAEKEGLRSEKIVKEIENKARLILSVTQKL